jgi:hypothetical protein
MLMQDLYKVLSDDTWVTVVTGSTVFSPKYNGLITDIPISLLDSYIKCLSIDMNHLLITIA